MLINISMFICINILFGFKIKIKCSEIYISVKNVMNEICESVCFLEADEVSMGAGHVEMKGFAYMRMNLNIHKSLICVSVLFG